MARLVLTPDTGVRVEFADRTVFGSPVGSRPEQGIREIFCHVLEHFDAIGVKDLVECGPRLLRDAVASPAFERVAIRRGSAWEVRAEVLYPDPSLAPPRSLVLFRAEDGVLVRANIPPFLWPEARRLIAELAGNGCDPADPELPDAFRRLLTGLRQVGLVTEAAAAGERAPRPAGLDRADLIFLGHNTVLVRSGRASVVVDPLLFPHSPANPAGYQPLRIADVGDVDAVLITHSHPDHFDPGSLLQFPTDTRIVVPALERETVLAVDMVRRLGELGFSRVTAMSWGERLMVGDIEVTSLPFFGEQPTDGEVLHSEIRNNGNTYVVRAPRLTAAFLADSGRDQAGDVKRVAEQWHAQRGPVDMVFSGYRGWVTYPVQVVLSSVGRYILFIPPSMWNSRLRLMNDVHDAVDVAERWGAQWVIPYADGGAPWHWRAGLGPCLDGTGQENRGFDPHPERLIDAARNRILAPDGTTWPSQVIVRLLRPGDGLVRPRTGSPPVRFDGHAWPYDNEEDGGVAPGPRRADAILT